MSVNTSEEYLDELLQAIEPIIYPNGPETIEEAGADQETEEVVVPMTTTETVESTEPEANIEVESVAEMESNIEAEPIDEVEAGTLDNEPIMDADAVIEQSIDSQEVDLTEFAGADEDSTTIGDLLAALSSEDGEESAETGMSENDIESILSSVSEQAVEKTDDASYDQDVKELLKQFTEDEDLSDIQDILDKNDNREAVDESMLDLPNVEVFQLEEDSDDEGENAEVSSKKDNVVGKIVGGFANFFKRKKEKKQKVEEETANVINAEEMGADQALNLNDEPESADMDEILPDDISEADVEELVLDEDLADIEQLLSGGAFQGENISNSNDNEDTDNSNDEKSANSKKKARKEKKNKKESVFSKIFNMLTEEIPESSKKGEVPESGATGITDENRNILEELSKEDKKKAKKEAKQDKKTKKNGKNASKKGEGDEAADGKGAKGKAAKNPKKEKKKREKKEKPRKVEVISKPEKKLPRKPVLSVFALCFSILAAILILQNVVLKVDNLKEAQFAYDSADYETCYANLNGVERSEEEEALYQKSFIVLTVQRKLDSYNNFMLMDREVEALNSLLEGVAVYKEQQENAAEWGVVEQITAIYQTILGKLEEYGLSEADIDEILAYESKVTYTKRLDSIVNGTPFVIEEVTEESIAISQPQPLEDVLPQEEDFLPEDTSEVAFEQTTNQMEEAANTEETEEVEEVEDNSSQGNTVVVGSNPVDVFDTDSGVTEGENVGSGNTNVSIELNGGNVVISDM